MSVRLIDLPEMCFATIEVRGAFHELGERVPAAWQRLVERLPEIPGGGDDGVFFGVFRQPGSGPDDIPNTYEYHVATQVAADAALPDGLTRVTIPARTYAAATVRGGPEQIEATYLALARWLDENGHREAPDAYGLERYETARQSVIPPYSTFDYDILRPLDAGG